MKLFIDTWGWIELRDSRGLRHIQIRQFYLDFRLRKGAAFTTDYVLDETITHIFRRLPFPKADESLTFIQQTIATGFLCLERITEERF
jgi:hypothetical protein